MNRIFMSSYMKGTLSAITSRQVRDGGCQKWILDIADLTWERSYATKLHGTNDETKYTKTPYIR